jgi:predicted nucleic acid-binding Zn finger protein
MPLPNGFPVLVDPYLRDAGIAVFVGTVSSGNVTKVGGLCTCGNFSSGLAAATFPKCQKAIALKANENTGSATDASNTILDITDIDAEAGTCNIRGHDKNDGTDQAPADGTFTFALLLSW